MVLRVPDPPPMLGELGGTIMCRLTAAWCVAPGQHSVRAIVVLAVGFVGPLRLWGTHQVLTFYTALVCSQKKVPREKLASNL